MALNLTVVKKHPVATGAVIIVGGLVLFMLMRGGGGGSGYVSTGPTDAQIAAGMQQAQMQFAAGQQASSQQFQLAAGAQNIQGQLALAQLQLQGQSEQVAAGLAAMGAQIELGKYQSMLAFEAQKDATAATVALQKEQLKSTFDLAKLTTDSMNLQATLAAQTRMFETAAFTDVQKIYYQGQTQLGIVQSNNQVKIEGIQADAQKYIAKKQGQSSMFGSLLGFAGTALSFFSDPRLKTHVERKGTLEDGTPLYNYKLLGAGRTRSGVMATEVGNPMAVDRRALGVARVDYGQVMNKADVLSQYRFIPDQRRLTDRRTDLRRVA